MSEGCETIVIGAGVVGLAIARALSQRGQDVIIIEREELIGSQTSSRNSEVIHAGLYYPKGSLKARLCVKGRDMLYDYCASHHVPHQKIGKLIVATSSEQLEKLHSINASARANGVSDLTFLSKAQIMELEPNLKCHGALLSPSTGIIDSHQLMVALLGDAEEAGALLCLGTSVEAISKSDEGFVVETSSYDGSFSLVCQNVINAAGHGAVPVANAMDFLDQETLPKAHIAKGSYFQLAGKAPFSHLIYPVPEPGGLGVHLTLDLSGQAKFGPDVEWVTKMDGEVDGKRAEKFYDAVRRYWPDLKEGALLPDYAGFRPKISGPGEEAADFVIQGKAHHGHDGLVNLFGIESPGLTSCLAIAEEAADQLSP